MDYLTGTLGRRKWEACKKKEIVEAILQSGADLAGKVPPEILDVQ